MKNYFKIFGLPQQFEIDLAVLDTKYFDLQRQAHPDMKGGDAVDSACLNTAYKTLKNRFKRAEYLIELSGKKNLEADQGLLMEMMELREEDPAEKLPQVQAEIEELFAEFAKTQSSKVFVRIKYLQRFVEEQKR
jgi:molecular chaperone HscB